MRTLVCLGVALAFTAVASADDKKENAKLMRGKVVRVSADSNTITIRTDDNKEMDLKVNDSTKYWDNDRKPLTTGLKGDQFKEGTAVWFQAGDDKTISVLRLSPAGKEKDQDKDKEKDK